MWRGLADMTSICLASAAPLPARTASAKIAMRMVLLPCKIIFANGLLSSLRAVTMSRWQKTCDNTFIEALARLKTVIPGPARDDGVGSPNAVPNQKRWLPARFSLAVPRRWIAPHLTEFLLRLMARPKRFELLTPRFVVHIIQSSDVPRLSLSDKTSLVTGFSAPRLLSGNSGAFRFGVAPVLPRNEGERPEAQERAS
jgi:hypothetical protein